MILSRAQNRIVGLDIDRFLAVLQAAYPKWQVPSVTLVAAQADATPFQVLVSTLLSLRTKDEVTTAASRRLFAVARTPEAILAMEEAAIRKRIYPVNFYPTKAKRLREISRILLETYAGKVPDTMEALLALPGVGRKTANLVLVEGFGIPAICVDTHVHRISNRIGYVATENAVQTEFALRDRLPPRHWIGYNELLVAFGQKICRPVSAWCSRCPVSAMCPKIGVARSR